MRIGRDPARALPIITSYEQRLVKLFEDYKNTAARMLHAADMNNTSVNTLMNTLTSTAQSINNRGEKIITEMTLRAYRHGQLYADLNLKHRRHASLSAVYARPRMLGAPAGTRMLRVGLDYVLNLPPDQQVLDLLTNTSLTNLKGVTMEMSKRITQELATGVLLGEGVDKLAERITSSVENVGVYRARLIARTETMRAVNQAALNRYYQAGVTTVQWLAGADDRCCDTCMQNHQKTYRIDMVPAIPVHPNCRCTLIPISVSEEPPTSTTQPPVTIEPMPMPMPEPTGESETVYNRVMEVADKYSMEIELVEAERRAVLKQLKPLEEEYTAAAQAWRDAFMNKNYLPSQREALRNKRDEAYQRWMDAVKKYLTPLDEKRDKLLQRLDEEVRSTILQRGKGTLTYTATRAFEDRPLLGRAVEFVGRLVSEKQAGTKIKIEYKKGRAKADIWDNTVKIEPGETTGTYIHEIGHILEHNNPEVRKACIDFYEKRTRGEPLISMNEATGNKGYNREMTRKDKFIDPYMGKDYTWNGERYATEIYSMGLQYLYEHPITLAREDPEMFKFIINVTRM